MPQLHSKISETYGMEKVVLSTLSTPQLFKEVVAWFSGHATTLFSQMNWKKASDKLEDWHLRANIRWCYQSLHMAGRVNSNSPHSLPPCNSRLGVKCGCADLRMFTCVKCVFECRSKSALYPLVKCFSPQVILQFSTDCIAITVGTSM